MLKDIMKRAVTHFGGSLVSKIFAGSVYIILSRYVSVEEYGVATLAVTVIMLGDVAGSYGLTQWYQKQEDEDKALGTFICARLLLGAAVTLGILVLAHVLNWFPADLALLVAGINMLQSCISIGIGYRIRHKKVLLPSLVQFFQAIPILILMYVLGTNVTVTQVLWAYALGDITVIALLFPRVSFQRIVHPQIPLRLALRSSSKYALLTYTSATYARGDAILVKGFMGNAALGIYGLAYRYLDYASLLPSSIVQILFPIFAQGGHQHKHLMYRITAIMTLIGCLVGGAVYSGAEYFITTLHGQSYADAIPILQILSITLVLFFVNAPLSSYVQASHYVKKFLPFGIANTALNIGLNLYLIPRFGLQAAAYTMLITEITGLCINIVFARMIKSEPI